jgi:hypothetical protein
MAWIWGTFQVPVWLGVRRQSYGVILSMASLCNGQGNLEGKGPGRHNRLLLQR